MCDDVGIEVTRLNAKLLIAALGEDAYPEVPHNFREALKFSSSGRMMSWVEQNQPTVPMQLEAFLQNLWVRNYSINQHLWTGCTNQGSNKYPDAKMFDEVKPSKMMELCRTMKLRQVHMNFLI